MVIRGGLRVGVSVLVSVVVAACGGGSGSDTPQPAAPDVAASYVLQAGVKELSASQTLHVDLSQPGFVETDDQVSGLATGDVVIAGSAAVKLGASVAPTTPGRTRFVAGTPEMAEVFSSLVLDGDIANVEFRSEIVASGLAQPLRAKAQSASGSCATGAVSGVSGINCSMTWSFGATPLQLKGTMGVGVGGRFNKYDLIKNTGSATLSLVDTAALELLAGYKAPEEDESPKVKACRSQGDLGAGQVRVSTGRIPTSIPFVQINVPVCVYVTAEGSLQGKLLAFNAGHRIDVEVGNGTGARVQSASIPNGGGQGPGSAELLSVGGSSEQKVSVLPVEVETKIDAGVQFGIEPALLGQTYAGLSVKTNLGATGNAKVAAGVIDKSKSLATLASARLYCVEVGVKGTISALAHASTPSWWLGTDKSIDLPLVSKELFALAPIAFGNCDFKVKVKAVLAVTPATDPSLTKVFSVQVQRDDVDAGTLWDDHAPSGTAKVVDAGGAVVCTAALDDQGQGSCTRKFDLPARDATFRVVYDGDEHYLETAAADSNAVTTRIDLGAIVYTGTSVGTGSCNDSNVTESVGGALANTNTPGVKQLTLNGHTYNVSVPGTSSGSATYPEADGATTENVTVVFAPPTADGSGTWGGSGSYSYQNAEGTYGCSGSYTLSGTYSF